MEQVTGKAHQLFTDKLTEVVVGIFNIAVELVFPGGHDDRHIHILGPQCHTGEVEPLCVIAVYAVQQIQGFHWRIGGPDFVSVNRPLIHRNDCVECHISFQSFREEMHFHGCHKTHPSFFPHIARVSFAVFLIEGGSDFK